MKAVTLALLTSGALSPNVWAANYQQNQAKVFVQQKNQNSDVLYQYLVENGSKTPITSVTVGFDHYHRAPDLNIEPLHIISPEGWVGSIVLTEETNNFEVRWQSRGALHDISAGGSKTGFGVVLPRDDTPYRSGHFTVIFGNSMVTSDQIMDDTPSTSMDINAPEIAVALTPSWIWPPNNKLVNVTAMVTVHDDQDPSPMVRLESIECIDCQDLQADVTDALFGTDDRSFAVRAARIGKRKEGRVYRVIYSATDAAGNRATAEAAIQVPHDQRPPERDEQ